MGLNTEVSKELLEKYPPVSNCKMAQPPKINVEVSASISQSTISRDTRLVKKQAQLSACLSATGRALSLILQDKVDKKQLTELLSDSGRLMADLLYQESVLRRSLLSTTLNEKFRKALSDAPIDEWLFGSDLQNRIVSAKTLEKSVIDLKSKAMKKPPQTPKQQGNYKRPFGLSQSKSHPNGRQTWRDNAQKQPSNYKSSYVHTSKHQSHKPSQHQPHRTQPRRH